MATSTRKTKPHALAVPLPFQGHIHPLIQLSKKLVSVGFMVTFANTQANHEQFIGFSKQRDSIEERGGEGSGQEKGGGGGGGELHFVSLEEGFPVEFDAEFGLLVEVFKPEMKASVARLLARLCMEDIAAESGIPSLSFWTQNAANFASNLLEAQGFQFPPDDSTLITSVEGVPPFKRSEISGNMLQSVLPLSLPDYAWTSFKHVYEPTWVVLNTSEELEATTLDTIQAMLGFRPLAFGPFVNSASFSVVRGIDDFGRVHTHLQWLHGHPQGSVLYIAFGTLATLSEEQLEEIVLGLEASEQPILWVFRPGLCGSSEKYTVEALSRRFERLRGAVIDWTSQWHVLTHPAVGGFLTHCGWNSTLEGIVAGVPMLTWPVSFDQFLNGRCLEEQWGVGLGFQADEANGNKLVSRIEVEKKVRELMQGKRGIEMRDKARALSDAAKRAVEKGDRDLIRFI